MKTSQKTTWIALATIIIISFSILTMGRAFASNNFIPPRVTPIDPLKDVLKGYEDRLKSDKLSKEEKEQLKTKYALEVQEATEWAERVEKDDPNVFATLMHTTRTPKAAYPTEVIVLVTPTIKAHPNNAASGIDEDPLFIDPHIFPKDIRGTNGWHKKVGDDTVYVYAGYSKTEPPRGMIYIIPPGKKLVFKKFLAPENSGAIHIVSENNMVLTLQNETGHSFFFDVNQESFVDQNGNVIPEGTDGEVTPTPVSPYPAP